MITLTSSSQPVLAKADKMFVLPAAKAAGYPIQVFYFGKTNEKMSPALVPIVTSIETKDPDF